MEHDIKVRPDSTQVNDNGHVTRQASGATPTAREDLLVDLTENKEEESMQTMHHVRSTEGTGAITQKPGLISNIIGLLPIPRGSQQASEKMKEEDVQMIMAALRQDNEALQDQKRAADNKIKSLRADLRSADVKYEGLWTAAQDKFSELKSQNKSFSEDNARLENTLNGAQRELSRLKHHNNTASQQFAAEKKADRQKLTQLHSQIELLQDKNDALRQMLVPVSEKQVLDAEVVQKFASLRSGIMGFVRQTWMPRLKHGVDVIALSRPQQDLIVRPFPMTYERLRCLVFTLIHENVFGSPGYFLGDDFKVLEQLLQRVERELNKHSLEVDDKLFAEWRNATFKVTDIFRDDGRHLSSELRNEIWTFLDPVQTKGSAAEQNGGKRLETSCDTAVELALMIRQLKDNFRVDNLGRAIDEPLSIWEELAEEVESVEVNPTHRPGTIAYVIMGALVKNPQENLNKVLVLEKAEVAVYR